MSQKGRPGIQAGNEGLQWGACVLRRDSSKSSLGEGAEVKAGWGLLTVAPLAPLGPAGPCEMKNKKEMVTTEKRCGTEEWRGKVWRPQDGGIATGGAGAGAWGHGDCGRMGEDVLQA